MGIDTSQPMNQVASRLEFDIPNVHPVARPPAFYVVESPLMVGPWQAARIAVMLLSALSVGYLVYESRRMGVNEWLAALAVLALGFMSLRHNNPALIWSALIVATWRHLDDDWRWGIPLGVAASLRLWPLLPVFWLMVRRRQTGYSAGATFVLLSAVGLLVVPLDVVAASVSGGEVWGGHPANLSVTWQLYEWGVPKLLTVGVGGLVALTLPFGGAVLSGALLSPVAWDAYLTAAVPLLRKRQNHHVHFVDRPGATVHAPPRGEGVRT